MHAFGQSLLETFTVSHSVLHTKKNEGRLWRLKSEREAQTLPLSQLLHTGPNRYVKWVTSLNFQFHTVNFFSRQRNFLQSNLTLLKRKTECSDVNNHMPKIERYSGIKMIAWKLQFVNESMFLLLLFFFFTPLWMILLDSLEHLLMRWWLDIDCCGHCQ